MRSIRISSPDVITRAFAWNPRCATIILVNSSARSTFDISNDLETIDASMVVLGVSDGLHVIFTVDEDPVFEQLSITLLRVLPEHESEAAADDLTQALYGHFSPE